ncbi:UNVERIFIED_CONTAM: hypothetical protein GTU68_032983 [Idotea baltica]|nr:hypothetical protein [Idotea baltica]
MVDQYQIKLTPKQRGFHLITEEVFRNIGTLPDTGILNVFIKHTSAAITINENADPSVRVDFETYYNKIVDENLPGLTHTIEGPDDMPAHIKAALTGTDVNIPITNGRLNLGTWQGLYLCEFRNYDGSRTIIVSIYH